MAIDSTIYIGKKLKRQLSSIIYIPYNLIHGEIINGLYCLYEGLSYDYDYFNNLFLDWNVVELVLATNRNQTTNKFIDINISETEPVCTGINYSRQINPKDYTFYLINSPEGKEELHKLYNEIADNPIANAVLSYLILCY